MSLVSTVTRHNVSDGFIITSEEDVSTQVDVLITNADEQYLIEDGQVRFYSIESVLAIGEVKSNLDKTKFTNALRKLAANKALNRNNKGYQTSKRGKGGEHDEILSFLVCKDVSFDLDTLNFDEVYTDVDRKYWHNSILVLEKALLHYEFSPNSLSAPGRQAFLDHGGNLDATVWTSYPFFTVSSEAVATSPVSQKVRRDAPLYHIELFIAELSTTLQMKTLFETQFVHYLDIPLVGLFKKEAD